MIRIKLSVDENVKEVLLPITRGNIADTFYDLSNGIDVTSPLKKSFHVVINGEITQDWETVNVKETDDILITPKLMGGDEGSRNLLRVLVVVAAIYTGGLAAGAFGLAQGSIGMVVSTTLAGILGQQLAFSAFPPTLPDTTIGGSIERSQSFAFTGQSNRANQFGFVPKVYGTHRIFPYIAATPYIELGVIEGKQVQYLHAIYDFGLGPNLISDIRIGDTPINDFEDVFYQVVDLNRPVTSEGEWDDSVANNFEFYKGDVSVESVGVLLSRNEVNAGNPANYEVIRNSALNSNNDKAEISVNGVFANGLNSVSSSGALVFLELILELSLLCYLPQILGTDLMTRLMWKVFILAKDLGLSKAEFLARLYLPLSKMIDFLLLT